MDKQFVASLKWRDSSFNANLAACIVDETEDIALSHRRRKRLLYAFPAGVPSRVFFLARVFSRVRLKTRALFYSTPAAQTNRCSR